MRLYEAPQVFPVTMTRDERFAVLDHAAQEAEETFQSKYFELTDWFDRHDALYLLAYCAVYFLSHPDGTDPELQGKLDFPPFWVELLQAFSLMRDRSSSSQPLDRDAETLLDSIRTLADSMAIRSLGNLKALSDREFRQHQILATMRGQTTAVRNWAYPQHMRKVTKDLAATIRSDFIEMYEVDPIKLVDTLFRMAQIADNRLNKHRNQVRLFLQKSEYQQVVSSYLEVFPNVQAFDAEQLFNLAGRKLVNLKSLLVAHSDLRLATIFEYTLQDIEAIYGAGGDKRALNALFDTLAMDFGSLRDQDREHLILDNPVWTRPFIRVDSETYFSAIVGLVPHYALGLLESLIAANRTLEHKYRQRKSRYLEDELESVLKRSFPLGKVYRGSLWSNDAGNSGENDLTLVVGSVAIVAESKSGLVSPSASRGAPARFRRTVKELVDEPAEQANNFIRVLRSLDGPHTFKTKKGGGNTIDATGIRYFMPLTVTLEQFGSVSNLKALVEAGISAKKLSELAPVISLTDLMVIFEILDLQSEKLHYLTRRGEFERHVTFEGDELDILALYLDQGLNLGEIEYNEDTRLLLTMSSKQLDPYFLAQDIGMSIKKPSLALTPWWRNLLEYIEARKNPNWLDAAMLLLNVPYADQGKFQKGIEKLKHRVRRGKSKMPHEHGVLLAGPPERQFFVAVYPYRGLDRDVRNSVISEILNGTEAQQAQGAICIGMDLDYDHLPYSVLAFARLPKLLDEH